MHCVEAEGNDGENTPAADNSRYRTRSTRSLNASSNVQQSAISEKAPIRQHKTADGRKRDHVESEDELSTGPAKFPKTREYSAAEMLDNWETVLIDLSCRINPEAVRNLLDTGRSEIKQQRSRIAQLAALLKQEREVHRGIEKHQLEKYAALEEEFRAQKVQMVSILTANVEAFGGKVSDDTIIREWKQLCYNVQNMVCRYQTNACSPGTSADRILTMHEIISRRNLWSVIYHHCFSGRMEHWYETIGQSLAHRICEIIRYLPSCLSHQGTIEITKLILFLFPNKILVLLRAVNI